FSLRYEVSLTGESLASTLHITNSGETPFDFQALLHTYLRVPEIKDVKVKGFEGMSFRDQLVDNLESVDDRPEAVFEKEVDRVYSGAIPDVSVVGSTSVTKTCVKKGPATEEESVPVDVVLWNPWVEKAQRLADFGDQEFHSMVCIEPGLVSK
ncbi:unnamed protein product, partial [Choristocarpus tenellus]